MTRKKWPFSMGALMVVNCMALVAAGNGRDGDLMGVDLEDVRDLMVEKFDLTPEKADEIIQHATDEGAISPGASA